MNSVLNIEPHNFTIYKSKNDFNYNFFDFITSEYKLDIKNYYKLLNSLDEFKLKNVYNYIYLKVYKIKKIDNKIKLLNKIENKISSKEFNSYLMEYIDNKLLYAIIVMNSIQLYFFPNIK